MNKTLIYNIKLKQKNQIINMNKKFIVINVKINNNFNILNNAGKIKIIEIAVEFIEINNNQMEFVYNKLKIKLCFLISNIIFFTKFLLILKIICV